MGHEVLRFVGCTSGCGELVSRNDTENITMALCGAGTTAPHSASFGIAAKSSTPSDAPRPKQSRYTLLSRNDTENISMALCGAGTPQEIITA